MKRYYAISAVVLAMAMTACVREDNFSKVKLGDEDFAFSISQFATKSGEVAESPQVRSFKLGDSGFFLEEQVTSLDEAPVTTKGTPIYTENIDKYYPTINVLGYEEGGSNVFVPEANFEFFSSDGSGTDLQKVYRHHYASDFWPENEDQKVWFYLKAPQDYLGSTASAFEYNTSDGSIEFDYTSPRTGSDQKDILFTSKAITKNEYFVSPNPHSNGGAPVTFYHALTAVKFRVGNDNRGDTKTIITKVKFTNLKSSGHCIVTPTDENVEWDRLDDATEFEQEFDNPEYSKTSDNTINYSSDGSFGSSWSSAAADKNLNDDKGSLTFWFIPQAMNDNVTLEVTFRVKTPDTPDGTEITHKINFGEQLAAQNVEWKAGQLRTYTLNPNDVDVEIFDTMNGLKKSDLHVTNTGNVAEFVRVMLVGNWYGWESQASKDKGDEPSILVGYKTDGSDGNDDMVTPWYRENQLYSPYFDTETFANGKPSVSNPWIFGTGSYFYYPFSIGPGDELAETTALFQSYDLPESVVPDIYIPTSGSNVRVKAVGVHLVMEVCIQAISTINPNTNKTYAEEVGEENAWKAAWTAVAGREVKEK